MLIQIGGVTVEAFIGSLYIQRNGAGGLHAYFMDKEDCQRGLWATLRDPDYWQVWAGWFTVVIDLPSASRRLAKRHAERKAAQEAMWARLEAEDAQQHAQAA